MTTPNMPAIAALERALQNCSLKEEGLDSVISDPAGNLRNSNVTLELDSDVALPYQWEQCLDLETGEIYYINWQTGMKAGEDPRKNGDLCGVNDYSYTVEEPDEEEEEEEGNLYYENNYSSSSSVSSAASSPCSSSTTRERERERGDFYEDGDHVLVVGGCKSCLMYFMLPKRVTECPKCQGILLHLDRLEKGSL